MTKPKDTPRARQLRAARFRREARIAFFEAMVQAYKAMSPEERAEHNAWWEEHQADELPEGSQRYGTSDWPGWKRYIPNVYDGEVVQ